MSQKPLKPWETHYNSNSPDGIPSSSSPLTTTPIEDDSSTPLKPSSYITTAPSSFNTSTSSNGAILASIGTHSGLQQTPSLSQNSTSIVSNTQLTPTSIPPDYSGIPTLTSLDQSSISSNTLSSTSPYHGLASNTSAIPNSNLQQTMSMFARYSQALQLTMQSASNLIMHVIGLVQKLTMFRIELGSLMFIPALFRPFRWIYRLLTQGLHYGVKFMTFGLISLPIPSDSKFSSPPSQSQYQPYNASSNHPHYHNPYQSQYPSPYNSLYGMPSPSPHRHYTHPPRRNPCYRVRQPLSTTHRHSSIGRVFRVLGYITLIMGIGGYIYTYSMDYEHKLDTHTLIPPTPPSSTVSTSSPDRY